MTSETQLDRSLILPESELPGGSELLAEGRAMAIDWRVEQNPFLSHYNATCEYEYKQRCMAEGRVMQHAQIGFRDVDRSCDAYSTIWNECAARDIVIDRYGICLDWSMAVPRDQRSSAIRGTGMIMSDPETFARLAASAPVAPHFGDFVLGFPAALENTQGALTAGCTAIGNFGQYFTFRVPGWDDDVETTRMTLIALGLIAAQSVPILVHSNIDDGFAAQFTDLTSALGMMEIERIIIEQLVGAKMSHCFGHHFSDPLTRLAFQRASSKLSDTPGTMIYGNTTSYRGIHAQNFASLARYLNIDALGQSLTPTGHAINAVPVTENERIPEVHEIVDAQLFSGRLIELHQSMLPLIDLEQVDRVADKLFVGAIKFRDRLMSCFEEAGIDTSDAFEMLLSLRRIGARKLERRFGVGQEDLTQIGGRKPVVPGSILDEIAEMAETTMVDANQKDVDRVKAKKMRVLVATTDVHEHGKLLIEQILRQINVEVIDGGVSTGVEQLIADAASHQPDAIAVSTYNGVALNYFRAAKREMQKSEVSFPFLIGGRLNQIPEYSDNALPVDVGDKLAAEGAIVCRRAGEIVVELSGLVKEN